MTPASPAARIALAAAVCLAALALPPDAGAYHEASEPSDGTVRSFRSVEPALELPELTVTDARGARVPLRGFRGSVVLLNLWATWCPPCVRELPALDRLQGKFERSDVQVVAVSLDAGGTEQARPFFERLAIRELGLYADPDKALSEFFPVDVLPANFLIDREGRVIAFLRSYVDWDAPEAERMLRALADADAPAR